ncbi:probable U3 small nucleolar RNA-associated protein 7 [Tanacetum coccineum]|uniref:Probable U3 small nucleolar RNA-associated protein 7 n=1 Tax=Tanacetum coccineum TaxID=301880 RepID=A0ABQ5FGB4_9ASTR
MFSKPRAMEMRHEVAKQEVRNVVKAIASIGKFWYAHPETNASLQGINMVRSINMARSVFVLIRLMQTKASRLESDGIEKTRRFDQHAIAKEVDVASRKNQFDLILPDLGPYTLDYTASGRYMVALGRKGHVTLLDLHTMKPIKDVQVRETVRDVVFLHNELLFATAQKKNMQTGEECGEGAAIVHVSTNMLLQVQDAFFTTMICGRCSYHSSS